MDDTSKASHTLQAGTHHATVRTLNAATSALIPSSTRTQKGTMNCGALMCGWPTPQHSQSYTGKFMRTWAPRR